MLTAIHPKLPMRDKERTRAFYQDLLGFRNVGLADYPDYLMVRRDQIEVHFFAFPGLDPLLNDGQIYVRTDDIQALYREARENNWPIHPAGHLVRKDWGMWEFSLLDPDHNLITFGSTVNEES